MRPAVRDLRCGVHLPAESQRWASTGLLLPTLLLRGAQAIQGRQGRRRCTSAATVDQNARLREVRSRLRESHAQPALVPQLCPGPVRAVTAVEIQRQPPRLGRHGGEARWGLLDLPRVRTSGRGPRPCDWHHSRSPLRSVQHSASRGRKGGMARSRHLLSEGVRSCLEGSDGSSRRPSGKRCSRNVSRSRVGGRTGISGGPPTAHSPHGAAPAAAKPPTQAASPRPQPPPRPAPQTGPHRSPARRHRPAAPRSAHRRPC